MIKLIFFRFIKNLFYDSLTKDNNYEIYDLLLLMKRIHYIHYN